MGRKFFGPFLQNYAIFAHKNTSRLGNISCIHNKSFLTCRYGYKLHFKTNLRNFYQFFGILERKMCAKGRKRAKNKEFVLKKSHGHNFAPIDPILNHNEPIYM